MKSYTDLEQSKKLADILPLESADMTLPFRHTKDDKYFPGCVTARSYIDVYNEMIALPGMDKEEICKLIQPCWSLAALLGVLPKEINVLGTIYSINIHTKNEKWFIDYKCNNEEFVGVYSNIFVDACYEMILKLNELKLL